MLLIFSCKRGPQLPDVNTWWIHQCNVCHLYSQSVKHNTLHYIKLAFLDVVPTPTLSLSLWGCGSLGWGVSHASGSSSPLGSILHVHQVEPQVLHVVLNDIDPPFSLSSPASLSSNVYLQDSFDTILLFSPLFMPKLSPLGLPYLVRDTRYSN